MKAKMNKLQALILVVAAMIILSACGSFRVSVETPASQADMQADEAQEQAISPTAVDSELTVIDKAQSEIFTSAIAWYGDVISAPEGEGGGAILVLAFDVGEIALVGADPAVDAQIYELRDKEAPGSEAHFWGQVACEGKVLASCQLVVDYLRPAGPGTTFDPQPVEGWEGVIYNGPPGPRSGGDDYFALSGAFHIQYGIWAFDENLRSELESLRDTGTVIKIWGQVLAGTLDWGGAQIQVDRFEPVENPSTQIAPAPEWAAVDDGWLTYINEPYHYQLRHPPTATITEFGVTKFKSEEKPPDMSSEEYMRYLQETYTEGLCVLIENGLGYIYVSAPVNQGFRFYNCGLTGLGAGDHITKTEEIIIGGQTYTANGLEYRYISGGETLDVHNEFFRLMLPDGTQIEYGSTSRNDATFEDYLMKGHDSIRQILSTYEPAQ